MKNPNSHPLGDALLNHVASAHTRVVLVAPFVKASVVRRIVAVLSPTVQLLLYTRWKTEEIVQGVSDLEVFDLLEARGRCELWLCDRLHAKLYVADSAALVGSANLTETGLGWSARPGLEVLVGLSSLDSVQQFLLELDAEAWKPDREFREQMGLLEVALRKTDDESEPSGWSVAAASSEATFWPQTRNPDFLIYGYRGDWEALTTSGREQVSADLSVLRPPAGLDEAGLKNYVAAFLWQRRSVRELHARCGQAGMRFGEFRNFVRSRSPDGSREAIDNRSQSLLRWLLYFLPTRFGAIQPNYSEVIVAKPSADYGS